jgi:glycosyltransferase involved in cell wall biosynthesis
MSEIILTIGIPTFNGEKYLAGTINSCISQIKKNSLGSVEIVISDNASTDSTGDISKKISEEYPDLVKYYRNEINIGFDKNVVELFKRGNGKYVHILGDDDFYCDDTLEEVLFFLKNNNNLSIVLLNIIYLNILNNNLYGEFPIDSNVYFNNRDDFFLFTKWRTSPISTLIMNRAEFNSCDLSSYYGNQWIHLGAIIDILSLGGNSCFLSKRVITVRTGNSDWSNHFGNQLEVGLDHIEVLSKMLLKGYNIQTYKYFLDYRYKQNFMDILNLAPFNFIHRLKISLKMVRLFKTYSFFWIIDLPFVLFLSYPIQCFKFLLKYFYFKFKALNSIF